MTNKKLSDYILKLAQAFTQKFGHMGKAHIVVAPQIKYENGIILVDNNPTRKPKLGTPHRKHRQFGAAQRNKRKAMVSPTRMQYFMLQREKGLEEFVQELVKAGIPRNVSLKIVRQKIKEFNAGKLKGTVDVDIKILAETERIKKIVRPRRPLLADIDAEEKIGPIEPIGGVRVVGAGFGAAHDGPDLNHVNMSVTNAGDIGKAHHGLVQIGLVSHIATRSEEIDVEKACKDFKIDILSLPSPTTENVYMQLAKKYYPIFKGCGINDFEVTKMEIAFYKNNPDRYLGIQFDYLEPDNFVMALLGYHKCLSAKWDTVKGIDQKKADKLYNFLHTYYPDCINTLNGYMRKIDKYAPTLFGEPEEEPINYAVIEGLDEFVEIHNLEETFCLSMFDRENQCRMAQFVEKIVLPKIKTKEWHWSHVRAAMVKCGIFADCNPNTKGYIAISDYKFAKSMVCFLPEYINSLDASKEQKKKEADKIAIRCRDVYKHCDDDDQSGKYKIVSDCIKELLSYRLKFV